jgi:Tfp pilus assembly protein PilO
VKARAGKLVAFLKQYPIAVLAVVVIVVCMVAVLMRGGRIDVLAEKETELNVRLRTINQNVKNSQDLVEDVETMETLVETIQNRLFDRNQRAVNINFFYDIEDRLNVRMTDIGQVTDLDAIYAKAGANELKLFSTISYQISLDGRFEDILTFIYELQRVDPFIHIASCQVAKGNELGSLEARLRLSVLAE